VRSKSAWFTIAISFLIVLSVAGNLAADSFSKHMKNANRFKSKEDVESAIGEYQEALKCKPDSIEAKSQLEMAYELLGDRLLNKGETELAIEAYQNALRTEPGSSRAQSWIGIAYERLGDQWFNDGETDQAIKAYRNALASVPDEPYWHEQLGIALEKKGDRDAALKEYRAAAELAPLDEGLQNKAMQPIGGPQAPLDAGGSLAKMRESIETAGGKVSAPVPISRPNPGYSQRARQAKLQGILTLWAVVDREGNVAGTTIVTPLGLGLDAEALKTVRTWKFQPATRGGTPVPVKVMIQISFSLF